MSGLTEAAQALWGPEWRRRMSEELDLNLRNVRKMGSGTKSLPPGVKAELATLLRAEARRLDAMAANLERTD